MDFSKALFSPEAASDPHPLFAHMREAAPVHRLQRYGWWAVTRHAEVARILRQPELFSSDTGLDRLRPPHIDARAWQELERARGPSMFNADPPEHTRLRKLVSAAFTPRAMTLLARRVQQVASGLVDAILQREQFDVVSDLAIPLPVTVIAEMLGVDAARGAEFKRWSDDLLTLAKVTREQCASRQESVRLVASRRDLFAYLQAMIAARRERPRDDLISLLVRAESEDGALTAGEVLGTAVLLLVAGNETTTNVIATGTHLLLEHPEVLAELRADPGLVPQFIEEVLRYDGPATMLFRRTRAAVEVAGTQLVAGELVVLLLSAANRDPRQFPEPDRFDIHRDTRGHLAFGQGIHFCVGAPLSRLEGKIAFTELIGRLPAFARAEGRADWNDYSSLRGLRSLPLRWERRAA